MTSYRRLLMLLAATACTLFALTATASAAPPYNDNFDTPQPIYSVSPFAGTNAESTTETTTDPAEAQRLQAITGWGWFNTVWHSFEAPSGGDVTFTVCASFPTNMIALVGSTIPDLSPPADAIGPAYGQSTSAAGLGHPSGCEQGSYPTVLGPIPVQTGAVIRPVLGSAFNGQTGSYTITTSFTPAPANDAYANRVELFSRHSVDGTNAAASTEANEANNPYTNYRTVWYDFYATDNSTVDIEVCSEFPANVVAYSGDDLPLTPVSNAQGSSPNTCNATGYLTFLDDVPVSSSQHLKIQVGGFSSVAHTGAFSIVARYNGVPVNETWNAATDLGNGASAIAYGDNTNSTTDPEAPSIGGQYRTSSVWYRWTAPADALVSVDTCDGPANGTDLMLAAFATNDPVPAANNLGEVGTDYDSCPAPRNAMGKISFSATAGKTYWIAVSAESTSAPVYSDFTLKILSAPANTVAPVIGGANPFVGTQLSVSNGTWIGSDPISYAYQWLRCDGSGDNCSDIGSATGNTYTLTLADVDSTIKARVDASNSAGGGSAYSPTTSAIDTDTDGDGVGSRDDSCLTTQTGTVKPNGCVPEAIEVTAAPTISGDGAAGSATGLTLSPGTAGNTPGDDPSVEAPTSGSLSWFRCSDSSDTGTCDARSATGATDHYVVEEDDLGGWIRGSVTWTNDDSQVTAWTDPLTVYKISIFNRPSITGTPQVGQTLTGVDGLGENVPETESGDDNPAVSARTWLYCTSPTDENTCAPAGQTGTSLTPDAGAAGKYVVFGVTWDNGFITRYADSDITGPIAAATVVPDPPAILPLDLAKLTLPKKAAAKGIVKSKGKFTIKTIQFACPAGGAACVVSMSYSAKVKGKSKRLGTSKQTIAAGASQKLSGKLSKTGLKLFKKNKKLKVTIAMKGSGGGTGKATFKEFTITR